jgi:hypothetical protein
MDPTEVAANLSVALHGRIVGAVRASTGSFPCA